MQFWTSWKQMSGLYVLPYDKPTERFTPILVSSNFLTYDSNKHVVDSLENGRLKPKPDPEVVGKGLEQIQGAVDTLKKGVSARKIVVTVIIERLGKLFDLWHW
ncbi:hypothetical protein GB937_009255 [Aspergillus fischeri]|nr:hypothetical protein GB937_009255 [Aspergillus fischeri]